MGEERQRVVCACVCESMQECMAVCVCASCESEVISMNIREVFT